MSNSIYRSVSEVIDSLDIEAQDPDSFLSNTKRYHIAMIAREGLKTMMDESATAEVRGLKMNVTEKNYIDLPLDYVKYLRVSELTDCGKLIPIAVDATIHTANSYLLDNLDRILLDDDGVALLGNDDDDVDRNCYNFDYTGCPSYYDTRYYHNYYGSYGLFNQYYSINHSFSGGVKFKEDKFNNRIQFTGKKLTQVVVEYVADPLKSVGHVDDLEIKTQYADALKKYVYKEIVGRRRSVPMNEKERARRDYREAFINAKIATNIFSISDLTSTTNLK